MGEVFFQMKCFDWMIQKSMSWCSTSRFSEDRSAFEKAPFAPVNSCNKGSSWGLKPSESEQGLRLTALKTHECLLRSFGDTSGPLIRLPKAKIASSSLGDLDGQIWATANGQLATVISCQDAKDLVRTNKRCNQRSCLSNFFRGCSLRSCSLISPPKLRPQVVFPPAGSLNVPDNDSSGKQVSHLPTGYRYQAPWVV